MTKPKTRVVKCTLCRNGKVFKPEKAIRSYLETIDKTLKNLYEVPTILVIEEDCPACSGYGEYIERIPEEGVKQ